MVSSLPSIEAFDAFFLVDVSECSEEIGFLMFACDFGEFFAFELDDDFDHVDGLNHAGREHAGEATDPEGLDEVEDAGIGGFGWKGGGGRV